LEGLGVRCEYNIKIELGCSDVEWIHLDRDSDKWRALTNKEFHKMRRICCATEELLTFQDMHLCCIN